MKNSYMILSVSLCLWAGAAIGQFKVLLNFNGTNGSQPVYSTPYLSNGVLYCPATYGGAIDSGTIFSIVIPALQEQRPVHGAHQPAGVGKLTR